MPERVLITGIGSISCFGLGVGALVDGLESGATGVEPIARFDTSGCRSHCAALIRDFDAARFIAPLKLRRIDAVGRVAVAAAQLALADAGYLDVARRDDVGVAMGTFTAGLDSLVEYLDGLIKGGPTGVPAILFSNTISNAPASLTAIEFGLRGPNVTFNQREASSLAALAYAVAAIRDGRTSAMLSGGADCLEETFFKVHDLFHVLSPLDRKSDEAARPFDRTRNGFVLGEGGFLLFLESADSAQTRGARPYGEVLGVGAAAAKASRNGWPDDHHGVAAAMRLALDDAKLSASDVSAVLGTANGSPVLDRLESDAIAEILGAHAVPVASIKGAIGESSAATAAAVVAAVVSTAAGRLPPTAGCANVDPALCVRASNCLQMTSGPVVIVNAVASGGTIYSLVVRASARPRS
jgi:3-oxoacyl-[acyl-carrier-protein] synthase II